jgi:hypothetical protein
MNRLLLIGLPVAKSVLYDRRSLLAKLPKSKFFKRNNHTISSVIRPRENLNVLQRDDIPGGDISYGIPASHEAFSTCSVRHQATRKRLLSVYKPEMVETGEIAILA